MPDSRKKRILICAGEISGDMYGAAIVREMRAASPVPLEFFGIGHGEAAVSAEAGEGVATAAAGHGTTDAASEEAAEGEDGSAEAGIVDGVVMVDPSQTPEALGGAIYMAPYNEVMDKAHVEVAVDATSVMLLAISLPPSAAS